MADDLYPGFLNKSPLQGRLKRFEVGAQRLQGNQLRPHNVTPNTIMYTRLPASTLRSFSPTQGINLANSSIAKASGISPSGNTSGFAYTSDASSITWYWDGTNGSQVIVITRADGSKQTVPTNGSGLTVSGLSAATTYYFLPFWTVNNSCNIGWVPGTVGSPQIAFVAADTTDLVNTPLYLMRQTTQGQEPLTAGFMSAATPAGGTGGGPPGHGGGPGQCVMSGTDIQTVGDLPYSIKIHSESEWVHLIDAVGHDLFCTQDHPLFSPDRGRIDAELLEVGDTLITAQGEQQLVSKTVEIRKCSKWQVVMPKGHLFWANGFLSHNWKYQFTL